MSALVSPPAVERPLGIRMRPDLIATRQRIGSQMFWILKDPLALEYFQLGDEEYFILSQLDGQRTPGEVRTAFESRFPPQKLDSAKFRWFLSRLHRQGLVLADAAGQGSALWKRKCQRQVEQRWAWLNQVLAIRFRGIDPEPWLKHLERRLWWVFTPASLLCGLLIMLAAAALVVARFDALQARFPAMSEILRTENLVWFALALFAVKLLHEIGHALTCKHFGGECHEVGLMLLVFVPCLYCNVSDSWLLSNKWQRVTVASAGILVELLLASLCTFLWWWTAPGVLHAICLNVMLLCSLNTLLLNGNPLLRYDGYYVLADLWEIPNLAERSRERVRQFALSTCLGVTFPAIDPILERHRMRLLFYGLASMVYRWLVLCAIFWLCYHVLKPLHLQGLVYALAAVTFSGIVVVPMLQNLRWLRDPLQRHTIRRGRLLVSTVVAAAVFLAVFLLPVPYHVKAVVMLEPHTVERLYVSLPGELIRTISAGTRVERGTVIAELSNAEMDLQWSQLQGEQRQQETYLRNLQSRRNSDPEAAQQLPTALERLADLTTRLEQLAEDRARLTLRSPISGVVFPPPSQSANADPGALRGWTGTPLEDRNLGSRLEAGTLFCLVGTNESYEATLIVPETEIDFVEAGQSVDLQLPLAPNGNWQGTVVEIAETDHRVAAHREHSTWVKPQRADQTSSSLRAVTYLARVRLESQDVPLIHRATGLARIHVADVTLAQRLYRTFRQTFGFRM